MNITKLINRKAWKYNCGNMYLILKLMFFINMGFILVMFSLVAVLNIFKTNETVANYTLIIYDTLVILIYILDFILLICSLIVLCGFLIKRKISIYTTPILFTKGYYINQSSFKRNTEECGRKAFVKSITDMILEARPGTIFRMVTHDSVIKIFERLEHEGCLLFTYKSDSLYKEPLYNLKENNVCEEYCQTCSKKAVCRSYPREDDKTPVAFYAIEIKRTVKN